MTSNEKLTKVSRYLPVIVAVIGRRVVEHERPVEIERGMILYFFSYPFASLVSFYRSSTCLGEHLPSVLCWGYVWSGNKHRVGIRMGKWRMYFTATRLLLTLNPYELDDIRLTVVRQEAKYVAWTVLESVPSSAALDQLEANVISLGRVCFCVIYAHPE